MSDYNNMHSTMFVNYNTVLNCHEVFVNMRYTRNFDETKQNMEWNL